MTYDPMRDAAEKRLAARTPEQSARIKDSYDKLERRMMENHAADRERAALAAIASKARDEGYGLRVVDNPPQRPPPPKWYEVALAASGGFFAWVYDHGMEFVLVGIIAACLGLMVLGAWASIEADDKGCTQVCVDMRARRIGRTPYGCTCEKPDGERFIVQKPQHDTTVVPMPVFIPSR